MASNIRVLVVDDSALMRQMVSRILNDAGFEVVGTARDGQQGLEAAERLKPDVITLDVEMPVMDGLTMLRRIMRENPLPVVMLSSLTTQQAPATIEALALGAVDVVGKPGGAISLNIDEVAEELISKVRVAATARVRSSETVTPQRKATTRSTSPPSARTRRQFGRQLVVVGSSTGGPRALVELVSGLPANFAAPMVIVQHMPAGFTASLAARLDKFSDLEVAEAKEGVIPEAGEVWVAPGGFHLRFDSRGRMQFDLSEPHLGVRPAVDLTMESAVDVWGSGVIGVILTGMGMDGSRGARRIKQAGGVVFAQDEASSVVFGMPRAVIEMGHADQVAPLAAMAELLDETVRRRTQHDSTTG